MGVILDGEKLREQIEVMRNNYFLKHLDDFRTRQILESVCEDENEKERLMRDWKSIKDLSVTPTKIIRSGPMTIIFWEDGTKTKVRKSENDMDDPYLAFCAGVAKKIFGSNSRVKKLIEEKTVDTQTRKLYR